VLAIPTDARTAPTAWAAARARMRSAKAVSVQPARRVSAIAYALSSATKPNAASDAPGLQKQPPRIEMPARRAAASI
jgi:hypothetical protein